ncbi:hypothetical protein NKK48_00705 [Mesorhizobium sp. C386A]|uniref:hypothetical protein n=1 Tax=unclassified Mesorhizobium TaxID=325217 RepID=UPI0003CE1547|nr:hypothetical protein [Mesorhizobium sp. LNJC386A00]ESY29549.1 hypothetical protein X748_27680 [Mesorhizobium sp. LNJC386A00]
MRSQFTEDEKEELHAKLTRLEGEIRAETDPSRRLEFEKDAARIRHRLQSLRTM